MDSSPIPYRLRQPHSPYVDEAAAELIERLERRLCVQSIAESVSEYLVQVNADFDDGDGAKLIPPTSIPWLAGGIAKRIVEGAKQ